MRILFLCKQYHIQHTPRRLVGQCPELRNEPHRWVRALASQRGAAGDILFDMRRHDLRDIVRQYPGGEPDLMIVWEPGYVPLPRGIEEAPFPVVACYSDWNLVQPHQAETLELYDHIFTDRPGVGILNRMGHQNVEFWPMWGHDPNASRLIPDVPKDWDIGMIGNLNADVQRERAPWLARVARLANRYRIRIAGGVYGDAYTRMMNATKITFNRSIRGEMNMRCYEAAACGSLLFYEEENEEIRDFFEDRVHCVLYNQNNVEELLQHYLSRDAERERIVQAAYERVQELSFPKALGRLADRIEQLDLRPRMRSRRFASLSVPELRKRQARQAAGWETIGCNETALAAARESLATDSKDAAALNDCAVIASVLLRETDAPEARRALIAETVKLMRRAVDACPSSAFYLLNLAHIHAELDEWEDALELSEKALQLLQVWTQDPAEALALPFPLEWREYRIQWAAIYNTSRRAPETWEALRRSLQFHRAGMLLGRAAEEIGHREMAEIGYRVAAAMRPDLGSGRAALGRVLAARGAEEEAIPHFAAALSTDPFITEVWPIYARALFETGREPEAHRFVGDALTILAAVNPSEERWANTGAALELEAAREALLELLEREPVAA